VFDLGAIEEREIYAALDWLAAQQDHLERLLARRHLKDGTLVIYDVSSSYLEAAAANWHDTDIAATTGRIGFRLLACEIGAHPLCGSDANDSALELGALSMSITADDEPLAGIIGRGDLGEVALVE
jgi:hypothetical protein